jgi:hypothetical protein
MFYLHIAYVNDGFQVFSVSVLDTCFKCFICLQTYVASVASKCYKVDQVLHIGYAWEAGRGASGHHMGADPRMGT